MTTVVARVFNWVATAPSNAACCSCRGPPDAKGLSHLNVIAPVLRTLRLLGTLFDQRLVCASHALLNSEGEKIDADDWLCGVEASTCIHVLMTAAACTLLMVGSEDYVPAPLCVQAKIHQVMHGQTTAGQDLCAIEGRVGRCSDCDCITNIKRRA